MKRAREQPDHTASLGDSIKSLTRIRFSVHTGTFTGMQNRARRQSVARGENEIVSSAERESQQARAQQHKAGHCQREESIGNQIVIVHDKPAVWDARPNLLQRSKQASETLTEIDSVRTIQNFAPR
jgi:hypothetical protein